MGGSVESTSACSKCVCSELDQCICILKQPVQRSRRTTPLRHGRHIRHYRAPDRFLGAMNALRFGACPNSLVAHSSRLITSLKFSRTIRNPSSNSRLYWRTSFRISRTPLSAYFEKPSTRTIVRDSLCRKSTRARTARPSQILACWLNQIGRAHV